MLILKTILFRGGGYIGSLVLNKYVFISNKKPPSNARTGILKTPHGNIKTPAFIFCGTKAAIKGLTPWEVKNAKTQIILSNTYHLMINPGPDLIKNQGGIHKFMNWSGPILTDSGGFQIFSMGHGSVSNEIKGKRNNKIKSCVKISENGAEFRSYFDGTKYYLTPEKSVEIQQKLGVDFIVMFDECTPFHVDKIYTKKSMDLTHRWGMRSINQYTKGDTQKQKLYGIVQGGIYMDLRDEAINFVNDKEEFFGIAIGGSLGKNKNQMNDIVSYTTEKIDKKRPCHLLGIGGIEDIINGSMKGIDTFDCVHPTRLARHGGAIVRKALRDSKKNI